MASSNVTHGFNIKAAHQVAYVVMLKLTIRPCPQRALKTRLLEKNGRVVLSKETIIHPESASLSRSTRVNNRNVSNFVNNLEAIVQRHNFGPQSIYNMDETDLTAVQK